MQTFLNTFSRPSRATFFAVVAVATAVCAAQALAQSSREEPTWYQVEVVIFERLSGTPGGDAEAWPKDIQLAYPQNWQKLLSPEAAAERLAEVSRQDDAPATVDPLAQAAASPPGTTAEGSLQNTDEEPLPPLLQRGDHQELAFVRLPDGERELNQSAGAIDRHRDMRVLFHEAWRQPMLSAEVAPSIIVSGGNSYGDHTELEGSLRISVSRYLHVYSNLWLTQFIPNYGQESEHWPPLPPVPHRQPAAETETEDAEPSVTGTQDKGLWVLDDAVLQDYTSLIEKPFLVTQIVTMKQARRMRSGELHYLDHPRLGLVIRVDRYQPETENSDN